MFVLITNIVRGFSSSTAQRRRRRDRETTKLLCINDEYNTTKSTRLANQLIYIDFSVVVVGLDFFFFNSFFVSFEV